MSTNLYIGNLDPSITNEQLSKLFSEAGKVSSAKVIIDRLTGQSRGFGFVEMSNEKEAQKAIELLNKKNVNGKDIEVKKAQPRK